jgi:hypothetical protein
MEQFQKIQQEISHRLKKAETKQVWRIKSKVVSADEIKADETRRLDLYYLQNMKSIKMMLILWKNLVLDWFWHQSKLFLRSHREQRIGTSSHCMSKDLSMASQCLKCWLMVGLL